MVLGAAVVAEAVAVVEAAGLAEVKLKTRSGSLSPSWATWFKDMKTKSLGEIYLFSLPIKESD